MEQKVASGFKSASCLPTEEGGGPSPKDYESRQLTDRRPPPPLVSALCGPDKPSLCPIATNSQIRKKSIQTTAGLPIRWGAFFLPT